MNNEDDAYFDLPYMQPPICPSASARRQLTRNCLVKQKKTERLTWPSDLVDDNLMICGRKLHLGFESEGSQTFCGRPTASERDLGLDHQFCRCAGVSFENRRKSEDRIYINDDHSVCHPPPQCRACHEQAELLSEQDKMNECFDTCAADAENLQNSAGSYSNVRIDQNRVLKVLRKFDAIRQRAREAKVECLLRFETRQKQRLRLLNLIDLERQQNENGQEVFSNDNPLAPAPTWNDTVVGLGLQHRRSEVKMRDVIDLCDSTKLAKLQTTWPPALDDSSVNCEPTNAVIGRLMSQFEQIRLNSATARLANQKRFNAKLRQRKSYK